MDYDNIIIKSKEKAKRATKSCASTVQSIPQSLSLLVIDSPQLACAPSSSCPGCERPSSALALLLVLLVWLGLQAVRGET